MSLNTVTTGNTILASDVNQIIFVLQRQSGQTETGTYWLQQGGWETNANIGIWIPTLSRNATPVSLTLDTTIQAPAASATSPTNPRLDTNGFYVLSFVTAASNTSRLAGNTTVQY